MTSMFRELEETNNTLIETRARQSFEGAQKARRRLVTRKRQEDQKYKHDVDKIIEATSRSSAAKAMRLGKLLNKQWYEYTDKFKVVSGLTKKDKERINI